MRPSEALNNHRAEIIRIAARHGGYRVRVFGSVLRGEDTEVSDLDLLVDVARDTSLLDLAKMQRAMQALLGVPVEVLTPGDLPTKVRQQVLMQAEAV